MIVSRMQKMTYDCLEMVEFMRFFDVFSCFVAARRRDTILMSHWGSPN